ncbi:MAG TPA: hypothetical protein VGV85_03270 [Longimicrobiaceae bacterium]|nr:hypothetical protein [Longimicrobiaceae bacterium]
MDSESRLRSPGGTSGGLVEFLGGVAMVVAGGYLLTTRVTVSSGYWTLWGYDAFGLSMLPLMVGIGVLFFNARSVLGWFLLLVGSVIIVTGIVANLRIYFQPTSLFNTIMILGLMAGGIGLIIRGLRPH